MSAVRQAQEIREKPLLPDRYLNKDFFVADILDYALKDDGASLEAPIFSLATKPDLSQWKWESKDKTRSVVVTPSVLGRATMHDKDVLIFLTSQLREAMNRGRSDATSRTVRFVVYNYLVSTNKATGGADYKRFEAALDRLQGTQIKTNIRTGGTLIKDSFGIIDGYQIVERSPTDERMIEVEVTVSKWLHNAIAHREVFTLHRDYFRLRKPLEKRLYGLARKHCGNQAKFLIGMELLHEKSGSSSSLKEFRRMVRQIISADTLPDYRLSIDEEKDQVLFYSRDTLKLAGSILKTDPQ